MSFTVEGNTLKKYEGTETHVRIPESIEEIGFGAFSYNETIQEVHLPESVKILQGSAFSRCSSLKRANLENIREIGGSAFSGCSQLNVDALPDGLETIGKGAFSYCYEVKNIKLPSSLTVLGSTVTESELQTNGVFEYSGLEQIDLASKISVIEARAFKNTSIKAVTIPENIKVIGEEAFYGCKDLQSVMIKNSEIEICNNAFKGCPLLKKLELPEGNSDFDSPEALLRIGITDDNGCAIEGNTLIRCDSNLSVIKVTDGVEVISTYAFDNCYNASQIILPDSVKVIEAPYISNRININIPDGYLRQETKIPVKATIALLTGPWKGLATLQDYACLYLFQSAAQLQKICRREIDKNPDYVCKVFSEVLSAKSPKNAYKKATEFTLEKRDWISDESILELYKKAKEAKISATVKSLEPFVKDTAANPVTKPSDSSRSNTKKKNTIESYCEEKYVPYLFKEFLKKKKVPEKYFKSIKYKDSEEYAPSFIVECAVVPYMQQLDEVPKKIGDYKRDFQKFKIDPDADKVASELDPQSLSDMLDSMFEKDLPSSYQVFVPFGRFGTSAQIQDLISRMNKWKDWYRYSSSGRMAIMVARGAIMLNDSKEAAEYAEKNKLTRYYAEIRGLTEKDIIDRINSIAYEIDNTMKVADGFGLDDNGVRQMTDTGIEAYVDSSIKLALRDKEGKTLKSIRGDKDAQTAYSSLKKEIDSFVKDRKKDIFKLYLRNDALSNEIWFEKFASHPVLKPLTKAVIWSDESGSCFVLTDNGVADADGLSYEPKGKIRPAHVLDMSKADIEKWRRYLLDNKKSLLIDQVWEPVIACSPNRMSDRYSGIELTNKERSSLKSTLKARNIDLRSDVSEGKYDPYQGIRVFSDTNIMNLGNSMTVTYKIDPDTKSITFGSDLKLGSAASKYEINAILFELDKFAVKNFISKDDAEGLNQAILDGFSVAQIIEFIDFAANNKSTNCTAVLQEYKNKKYPEYDAFSEFVLD